MADPPYGEREYRAFIQALRADVYPCWHRCGRRATTPDHVPALAEHRHEPGTGCCRLLPCCAPCQYAGGARLANRRRRRTSRRRLASGTGWSAGQ